MAGKRPKHGVLLKNGVQNDNVSTFLSNIVPLNTAFNHLCIFNALLHDVRGCVKAGWPCRIFKTCFVMVYSVSIELYLLRGFYNWRRGWFSRCKGIIFLVKMSFKDLEIGGIGEGFVVQDQMFNIFVMFCRTLVVRRIFRS